MSSTRSSLLRQTALLAALVGTLPTAQRSLAQSSIDAGAAQLPVVPADAGGSGPGFAAVPKKHAQIANVRIGLEYFQTPQSAPESLPGGGVRQYFSGTLGAGAIYWSARTGAHYTYGPLLAFLEEEREQSNLFYPLNDPQTGPGEGCPSVDVVKRQIFTWIRPPTRPDGKTESNTIYGCMRSDGTVFQGLFLPF